MLTHTPVIPDDSSWNTPAVLPSESMGERRRIVVRDGAHIEIRLTLADVLHGVFDDREVAQPQKVHF